MRVDGRFDLVLGRFKRHRKAQLGDHLRCISSDDMGTDDLTVRLTINDLHKAFRFADCECLAAR